MNIFGITLSNRVTLKILLPNGAIGKLRKMKTIVKCNGCKSIF